MFLKPFLKLSAARAGVRVTEGFASIWTDFPSATQDEMFSDGVVESAGFVVESLHQRTISNAMQLCQKGSVTPQPAQGLSTRLTELNVISLVLRSSGKTLALQLSSSLGSSESLPPAAPGTTMSSHVAGILPVVRFWIGQASNLYSLWLNLPICHFSKANSAWVPALCRRANVSTVAKL